MTSRMIASVFCQRTGSKNALKSPMTALTDGSLTLVAQIIVYEIGAMRALIAPQDHTAKKAASVTTTCKYKSKIDFRIGVRVTTRA